MEAQPNPRAGDSARTGRIGNPPHEVTEENRDAVRLLAGVASMEVVAARLGFSVDTLRRHYKEDYEAGQRDAVVDVKAKVLSQALEGNMNAAKVFLALKGELKRVVENTGPGGGPIRTVDLAVLAQLCEGKTEQELAALEQALSLVLAATGAAGGTRDGSADAESHPAGEAPA